MKPHTLCLDEIQPEHIISLDTNYNRLSGELPVHGEVPIHVEVLRARPDVNCVVHTLGVALAQKLGNANACLMKSHGIVVVGETIEQACIRAYYLERAAQVQFVATQFGEPSWTDEEEAEQKVKTIFSDPKVNRMWQTMVRRLIRKESVYK